MASTMPGLREWVEEATGVPVESLEPLPPGAGRRRYVRVKLGDGGTRVVMHAVPEDPAILPPALEQDDLPFIELTHFLASHDIPVPEIFAVERENRWLLLEDLGTTHLGDLSGPPLMERLREATGLIARVHAIRPNAFPFQRSLPSTARIAGFSSKIWVRRISAICRARSSWSAYGRRRP